MRRLPVPPLDETLDKYLASVEPLVDGQRFKRTKEIVERFRRSEEAAVLQKRLEEHAANPDACNWLEGWWSDMYFEIRDPNPTINYTLSLANDPACKTGVDRAARLVTSALKFKSALDSETLEPDRQRDGSPLTMDQFRNLFSCSRIPHPTRDFFEHYPDSRHIVVIFRNNFYALDVVSSHGEFLPTQALRSALQKLVDSEPPVGPGVGALTAEERKHWGEVYSLLSVKNRKTLDAIQSAILTVCLDENSPASPVEVVRTALLESYQNRWFEKLNLIVSKNGVASFNSEHSSLDGSNLLRLVNFMVEDSRTPSEAAGTPWKTQDASAKLLPWKLEGRVAVAVEDACINASALADTVELAVLHFKHFGKQDIVKQKMSPDAFAQMGLQLAFSRHFGRQGATYESATTRQYLHGRTETIRSVTNESKVFVDAMNDPQSSTAAKRQALLAAGAAHSAVGGQASSGRGVDRHLFGLRKMVTGAMPEIFTDPTFGATCNWVLSTSHCGSENLAGFSFYPVVHNGLGVGYMVNKDDMIFSVSSKWIGSRVFSTLLESSMLEMMSLFDPSLGSPQAKL